MGFDSGGESDSGRMQVLGQLSGGIAHEINNWLFVIRGFSELARLDVADDDPVTESLDRIEEAVDLAEGLTRMMLECAHPSGDGVIAAQLQPLVKEAVKLTRDTLPEDVHVHQGVAAEAAAVEMAPVRVFPAVMTLLKWAAGRVSSGGGLLWTELAEGAEATDGEISTVRLTVGSATDGNRSDVGRWLQPDPADVASVPIDTDDVVASLERTFSEYQGKMELNEIAGSGRRAVVVFPSASSPALR